MITAPCPCRAPRGMKIRRRGSAGPHGKGCAHLPLCYRDPRGFTLAVGAEGLHELRAMGMRAQRIGNWVQSVVLLSCARIASWAARVGIRCLSTSRLLIVLGRQTRNRVRAEGYVSRFKAVCYTMERLRWRDGGERCLERAVTAYVLCAVIGVRAACGNASRCSKVAVRCSCLDGGV